MQPVSSIRGGVETSLNSHAAQTADRASRRPSDPPVAPPEREQEQPTTPPLSTNEHPVPTLEQLRDLAAEVQQALDAASREPFFVEFRQADDRASFVLELRNSEGELIRQFPPEKVLNLRDKLDELSGMVIDEVT
jgi:uncharacterized FlaG/YvyC family protein